MVDIVMTNEFGNFLQRERYIKGLSVRELSDISQVSRNSIVGYEEGSHEPSLANATALLRALGYKLCIVEGT